MAWTGWARCDARGAVGLGIAFSFIVGCLCFYFEALTTAGVTAFLIGSVLMLVDTLLGIFERSRSSSERPR